MTIFGPEVGWPLPSLDRPSLDRLQPDAPAPNVIAAFLERRARPWGGARVALSPAVTGALWVLLLIALVLAGGMIAVRSGMTPCSGPLCFAVTLGDHPLLTLVLAAAGAVVLVAASTVTRGLTEVCGPQLAVVVVGAMCALVASAGVLALVLAGAFVLAIVAAVASRL
jgi:hypothetical protein